MQRGDLVTVALPGDLGKPRPALVIQSDLVAGTALTVLPITSAAGPGGAYRIAIEATPENGLVKRSWIMVDKITSPPRPRIGTVIGRAASATIKDVDQALALFLGLA